LCEFSCDQDKLCKGFAYYHVVVNKHYETRCYFSYAEGLSGSRGQAAGRRTNEASGGRGNQAAEGRADQVAERRINAVRRANAECAGCQLFVKNYSAIS